MPIDRRWMIGLGLAGAVLAGAASAHPPSILSPAAEAATADEIIAFRKALSDAIAARDVAKLRGMYTDGFVHTHTTGKMDGRDTRIVSALAGEPVIETAPVEDLKVRVPGGWTAIATGVSPIQPMIGGKDNAVADPATQIKVHWTAVYVRGESGDWQLAASHATRAAGAK